MTYRILVTDDLSSEAVDLLHAQPNFEFDVLKGLDPNQLAERIPAYDGLIVRSSAQVTDHVIAAGDRLRVIGRAGAGIDNIDLRAASERGVIVMNTPGANTVATAEPEGWCVESEGVQGHRGPVEDDRDHRSRACWSARGTPVQSLRNGRDLS